MTKYGLLQYVAIVGLSLLLLGVGVDGGALHAAQRPPNLILILIDDLGWKDLGCQGSPYYQTPQIDRLATEGMRFTNGYAACAICSPTRAAIQTGRYGPRTGVTDWLRMWFQEGLDNGKYLTAYQAPEAGQKLYCPPYRHHLELDEITIGNALQAAGYVTCHVGKWHLGQERWYPDRHGYDVNIGGSDLGLPGTYFDPYDISLWSNFPYYKKLYTKKLANIPTLPPRRKGEYLTDRLGDEAVGFIRANKDRPFFLNFCHYAVHYPWEAKEPVIAKYRAKPAKNGEQPSYAAMIESVDDTVGRIMDTLKELKLDDDTVVVFTSDNGGRVDITNNAPLRSGKASPYEGGIRVPWIVRWPGAVKAGSVSDVPISSIDAFPTLLEMAGVALPQDRPIDGVSLVPVLKQAGKLPPRALYWHYPHYCGPAPEDCTPYSIIRADQWKLIRYYEDGKLELFNLAADIGEQHDLAGKMPEKARQLDAQLTAWLKSVGGQLPGKSPEQTAASPR